MSHLPTHRSFYHCGPELPGQAIMVQRKWASTVSIGDPSRQDVDWGHEILVPGCMHMLWWITAGVLRGVINMYLNSHSAAARVQQLKAAVSKLGAFRQRRSHLSRCEFIFGGDRNFIMAPEHRLSSNPSGNWFPGTPTLQAWKDFMESLGNASVVEQSDFTWQRLSTTNEGEQRYCKKILDVAGVAVDLRRYFTATSTVANIPYKHASDHQPVSIVFAWTGRAKPARERGAPRIPFVPELDDADFSNEFNPEVERWKSSRP